MGKIHDHNILVGEQISYYQARAHEYDEWFFRQGRYDRGDELNKQWFSEVKQVRQAVDAFRPTGYVLEIACGTGLWTEQLVQYARQVTAVDAVPEMLAVNQSRVHSSKVRYIHANIFDWSSEEQYDVVFFGFWLSHVPSEKFETFWRRIDTVLKPDGTVFFVDSRYDSTSTAKDHCLEGSEATSVKRRLNDGREFRIVKIFYEAMKLSKLLSELGWKFEIEETPNYFIYGSGHKKII
jgi:2-polyprenyl-3-methyl-5-hydroxy-6-metoxy-1,4-benzoquinol methylase